MPATSRRSLQERRRRYWSPYALRSRNAHATAHACARERDIHVGPSSGILRRCRPDRGSRPASCPACPLLTQWVMLQQISEKLGTKDAAKRREARAEPWTLVCVKESGA